MQTLAMTRKMLVMLVVILTAMVAGEFYIFSYGVNGGFAQLSGSEYTQAMRVINFSVRGNPFFGVVFFGALALPLLTLLTFWDNFRSRAFVLFVIAFATFFVGTFLVTFRINIPLNYYLESWDVAAPAADWQETRIAWNRANDIRAWAAVVASGMYMAVVALLDVKSVAKDELQFDRLVRDKPQTFAPSTD